MATISVAGPLHRPRVRLSGVQAQRRQKIIQARLLAPSGYARQGLVVGVRRLPLQSGEASGEVHRMLAGPRSDLQDQAAGRQAGSQDVKDGVAVSSR